MRPSKLTIPVGAILCVAISGNAWAQDESPIDVGVDLEYRSRYLFAGIIFSTGSVLQTRLSLARSGFTLNAFANYDANAGEFSERDVSIDYSFNPMEKLDMYVGVAWYNFKNIVEQGQWDPTYEFYAGISTSLPGNPSIHYARDYSLTKGGQVAVFSMSHEMPIDSVKILGSVNIAYNDHYYRIGSNLSHFDLSLSTEWQLGRVTVTPKVTYQNAIAADFRNFWVGILTFHRDF